MEDRERVLNLEKDMSDVKTRLAVAESNIKEIQHDIRGIKDNTTWILRLVGGAIIGAIIAYIINGGIAV